MRDAYDITTYNTSQTDRPRITKQNMARKKKFRISGRIMKTKIHSATILHVNCAGTVVCKSEMAKYFIWLQFRSYVERPI